MANIENLTEGIEPRTTIIPESVSEILKQELLNNEHKLIEFAIKDRIPEIAKITRRTKSLLSLFDHVVLGGFSLDKEHQYVGERYNTCIPCFARYPANQPAWVRLTWGISRLGGSEETQYDALLKEAAILKGEESERFLYALRSDFLERLEFVSKEHKSLRGKPLIPPPEIDSRDLDDITSEDEIYYDLRDQKKSLAGAVYATITRYRFMVDLISGKNSVSTT